jgi:hypothetical protein
MLHCLGMLYVGKRFYIMSYNLCLAVNCPVESH